MMPITLESIEAEIASEHYFTAGDGASYNVDRPKFHGDPLSPSALQSLEVLTFCVLVLKNGLSMHGHSTICNEEEARKQARNRALTRAGDFLALGIKEEP